MTNKPKKPDDLPEEVETGKPGPGAKPQSGGQPVPPPAPPPPPGVGEDG